MPPIGVKLEDYERFTKATKDLINGVGFPIVAFLLMSGMFIFFLVRTTKAMENIAGAITLLSQSNGLFQSAVVADHKKIFDDIEKIKERSYRWPDVEQGRPRRF